MPAARSGPEESCRAIASRNAKPAFLITIDTEGDNLWACPRAVTTENAQWIPRFQSLCESHGLRPTYLTDYEMAVCSSFSKFGRELCRRDRAEIGAHLHPWNTPPAGADRYGERSWYAYVTEYPPELVHRKVGHLTHLLEDIFEAKMTSHRAGRWGLDGVYAAALIDNLYRVDCSVTPGISWDHSPGASPARYGPDYRHAPLHPYFLDLADVAMAGDSTLLEVPVTIGLTSSRGVERARALLAPRSLVRRAFNRWSPQLTWMRPDGNNLRRMLRLLESVVADPATPCVEFMLHSSELMPGGSPTFRDEASIEKLYEDLAQLFVAVSRCCRPATLSEFAQEFIASHAGASSSARTQHGG